MKQHYFKLFTFFILVATLSSCEDVVQVKLEKGENLVVIDAFINDLPKDQVVRVINNNDFFATQSAEPITNAQVVLNDLTANKQFVFNYTSNGNYVFPHTTTDTLAKLNHQYQLNITVNGYTYTSQSVLKRTAVILGIQDSLIQPAGPNDNGNVPYYNCFLLALDEADDKPDYYWVKTYRNDTLFSKATDINLAIDGTGGEVYGASTPYIFFTPPAAFLGFNKYVLNDKCRAEVYSISKETYNFLLQAQLQVTNGGLFATTPENVRTNLTTPQGATKAVGWFCMSAVTSTAITIQ